ncbi:MAG: Spy/CpxP family protein refolding chaperone, partial [Candidatus Solibacter sp.]
SVRLFHSLLHAGLSRRYPDDRLSSSVRTASKREQATQNDGLFHQHILAPARVAARQDPHRCIVTVMKLACLLLWITTLGIAQPQGQQGPPPGQRRLQPQPQPQPQFQPQRQQQPLPQRAQQSQPGEPNDFAALKSFLSLTDTQLRQMQQAREKAARDAGEKEKTLRPQIEEKRRALAELLDRDSADPTAVGKSMLEIRGLERQIKAAHEAARDAAISLMNPEQRAKFRAIQDAANLPAATRQAQRLGLVPPPPGQPAQLLRPDNPEAPRPRLQAPQPQPGPGPRQGELERN